MAALRSTRPAPASARRRRAASPTPAAATPLVAHVLTLQRQAGNRAVAAGVAALQRRKARGHVEIISAEDTLGADALAAILFDRAREERLGDLPPGARAAGETLLRCMHGRLPDGGYLPIDEQLALYQAALPPLEAMLGRALAASDGDLPTATKARQGLAGLHESLVADRARGRAAEAGKAAELVGPREKVERMKLAELARRTLDLYVTGEEYLDKVDTQPGLSKELRASRIAALKGIVALCDTDEWPSYTKLRDDVDRQLERTDPDRMLGAGAAVLEHAKKATEWTTASLTLVGMGTKAVPRGTGDAGGGGGRGEGPGGPREAVGGLAAIDILHGTMVLLDSNAKGSEKVGAALEVISGGISVPTGAAAGAVGAESVAAAAGQAAPWAAAVTINYKAYKALAEYTYSNVVGGLSMVEVTNEMEGDPIFAGKRMFRPGGLDDLGKAVTEARLRVESLGHQLDEAAPGDAGACGGPSATSRSACSTPSARCNRHWARAPLAEIRAYMPRQELDLEWQNATSPDAEPWMVTDEARRWEEALQSAFIHKEQIVEATMHATMAHG